MGCFQSQEIDPMYEDRIVQLQTNIEKNNYTMNHTTDEKYIQELKDLNLAWANEIKHTRKLGKKNKLSF